MDDSFEAKTETEVKKSSISILQELAILLECPPVYDLVEMSGLPHTSFFKVQVRFAGLTATGTAGKKQLAKHCAANEMLKVLREKRPDLKIPYGEDNILEPNKTEIDGNPIGELKALCLTHDIEELYSLTNEKGPTHAREFEMTCTVGTVETVGRGKTKKIAKKEAASKMMRYFVDMPEDIHPHEWLSSLSMDTCQNGNPMPNSFNVRLLNLPKLRLLIDSQDIDASLARETLKTISEEQNFTIKAQKIEKDGELQTTVFLGINFDSTFVVIGQGLDLEAALDHAALQALRFLKSLFSPSEVVNL